MIYVVYPSGELDDIRRIQSESLGADCLLQNAGNDRTRIDNIPAN